MPLLKTIIIYALHHTNKNDNVKTEIEIKNTMKQKQNVATGVPTDSTCFCISPIKAFYYKTIQLLLVVTATHMDKLTDTTVKRGFNV